MKMELMPEKLLTIFVLFLLSGLGSCDDECNGILFNAFLITYSVGVPFENWTLKNVDTGTTVSSGVLGGSGTIDIEECLDQACYVFEIEDSTFGSFGNIQSYSINLDGEQIYYSDGQFGYGEKVSFCAGGCDDYKFSLSLDPDYYRDDISWILSKFDTGSQLITSELVISGDNYRNIGGYEYYRDRSIIYVEQCINPGCYGFQISDDFGDGICDGQGGCGNYEISVDEQQIYYSNGQYGSGEQLSFCVGSTGCVESPWVIADVGKDCADVANDPSLCNITGVKSHCPSACGVCADYACEDSTSLVEFNGDQYSICELLESLDESVIDDRCARKNVYSTCRKTCGNCVYP